MRQIVLIAISFILFCAPARLAAQNSSVDVIRTPDWDEIFRRAQEENKPIFLDCGTVWCLPCKKFAAEVLTIDSVAALFNSRFINVYIDLNKDKFPPVLDEVHVRAVPALYFIDAKQKRVLLGQIGFHDAPALTRFMREALGDDNIPRTRQRFLDKQLDEHATALFLLALSEGGLNAELNGYLPDFFARTTVRSLRDTCVWELCEVAMNSINHPMFKTTWDNRQILFDAVGKDRVLKKFYDIISYEVYLETNWKQRPDSFSNSIDTLYAWIAASDVPGKEKFLVKLEADKIIRNGNTDQLLAHLAKAWKDNWGTIEQKKDLIVVYIQKVCRNGSDSDLEKCVAQLDKFIRQTRDNGAKIAFLDMESTIWRKLDNPKKAQKAYDLARRIQNPHLYR